MEKEMNRMETDDEVAPRPDRMFGVRHLQGLLMFLGLVSAYSMRVNLSVTIVPMSNSTGSNPDFPDYGWDSTTQSTILSSFFWGYVVTQVPAGQLGQKFGGKLFLLAAVGICSIFNIVTPLAAQLGGWQLVCACRVLQGLSQGFCFPSTHNLLSKWAPVSERGTLTTYIYCGSQVGTFLAMPICGFLSKSSAGWPSAFYLFGGLGILWSIVYYFLGADSPESHSFISDDEKLYIESSLAKVVSTDNNRPTPWVPMLTSLPMWAVILAHCGQNWGFWTLLTEIPSYMTYVLNFSISENGLLSALPYFAMWLTSFGFSWAAEYLDSRKILSLVTIRKVFNTISLWGPAAALIGLAYVQNGESTLAVTLLTIGVGVNSACYVGFQVNHIDLSPNYAGTMMGITNCLSNFMSIIGPLMVGVIVTDQYDTSQWQVVFYIAAAVYFFCNLFFVIFGQATVQPWNDPYYKRGTENNVDMERVGNQDEKQEKE